LAPRAKCTASQAAPVAHAVLVAHLLADPAVMLRHLLR
jgi:hypothetical protein